MSSRISESGTLKLFGMCPKMGRWIFVALGFAINVCLSNFCSWSVFTLPLQKLFRLPMQPPARTVYPLSVIFYISKPFAGGFLDKCSPVQTEHVMKNNTGE